MSMTNTVLFRPMKQSDLPAIMEIEHRSFSDPWSELSFTDELMTNDLAYYVVAIVDGNIAGYAGMWVVLEEAQITNVAIHPDYRNSGLGKGIVSYLIELAQELGANEMTLEVRKSNQIAQRLYRNLGFKVIGQRKGYYPDNGEDAILMGLIIENE
jgi:ribosomal-protein-alanine N-acetyltransferase